MSGAEVFQHTPESAQQFARSLRENSIEFLRFEYFEMY
jgi:hypothetical protein